MSSGVDIILLAFSAALNPTLLAATTVMLLLPRPRNLMLGYLLGAMMTSVSLGLVIVFSLESPARSKSPSTPSARWATSSWERSS